MSPTCRAALSLLLLLGTGTGWTQTVYRCGSAGNDYSTSPCADGRAINTEDSRTDAQRQEAADAAKRARELAVRLRRERQTESAAALAGSLSPPKAQNRPTAEKTKKAAPHPKSKKKHANKVSETEGLSEPIRVPGNKPKRASKKAKAAA
jgi:hypothetical protein